MHISTVLDKVDSGDFALPEFQRGYVWTRDQVRGFFRSLYRGYPIGGFLTWSTSAQTAATRGGAPDKDGNVQLLLDGQQRVTTLYGVLRGRPPRFFEGQASALSGLHFHMGEESFEFYAPVKMKDPAWVDVTTLMQTDPFHFLDRVTEATRGDAELRTVYLSRLNRLHQVGSRDVHIEEVTGEEKSIDVVVEIFNRVNSGGTKLSKGDLTLAAICARWPQAREEMNAALQRWKAAGFTFKLDWLLRNVNAVVTGEALFTKLQEVPPTDFRTGLSETVRIISTLLDTVGGRLGLDHDRVLAGRGAFPTMSRILHRHGGAFPDAALRDRVLFWYVHSFLRGRYAGSSETALNQDLTAFDRDGVDGLIEQLRFNYGELVVRSVDFAGHTVGARVYPLLYLMTRATEARDFGSGIPLRANLLGRNAALEIHHIFPKARLAEAGYARDEINAVANFCFLTKDTNLRIGAADPESYLAQVEQRAPGAVASQWIPLDHSLWRIDRYRQFLASRRQLLAEAANGFLASLRDGAAGHDDAPGVVGPTVVTAPMSPPVPRAAEPTSVPHGSVDDAPPGVPEVVAWLAELGMSAPEYDAEVADPADGRVMTVAAAFWPNGLQAEAGSPVVLLPDPDDTDQAALDSSGFQVFHEPASLRRYVERLLARQSGRQPWEAGAAAR